MTAWSWFPNAHGGALFFHRWPIELDVIVSTSGGPTVARWRLVVSGRVVQTVVAADA